MAGLFFSPGGSVPAEVTALAETVPITTIAALKNLSLSGRPVASYAENLSHPANPLISFSAFSNSTNNLPQNVIDKQAATFYQSVGTSNSEFLQIDLGASYDLRQVEFTATTGLADRLSFLSIQGSLNADMSSPVAIGSTSGTNALTTVTLDTPAQPAVRYIRFSKTGGSAVMQIAEVRIWAEATGSYPAGSTIVIPTAIANPTKPKIVRVLGRSLINDGGGGEFYLDSADVESLEDGGIIFVAANGDRWKRVIEGDSVNVRWWGADHCTSAADPDQGAAITAALRGAAYYTYGKQQGNGFISWNKAMKVIIPPGIYNIRKAIRMPKSLFGTRTTGTYKLIIEGNGRVELQWRGNSIGATDYADRAAILFENYFYSSIRDIHITVWGALEYGILMLNNGGNPTATGINIRNVHIQSISGTPIFGGKFLKYGIGFPALGTGGDANNDLPTVTECTVDSAHIAFYGYGLNYHDAVFDRCKINSCNWGVNFGNVGYLRWTNGSSGDTKYADFYFRANSYPSYIIGHNAEHAGRLIDAKNCIAPIYMTGIRYNSQRSFQTYAVVVGSDTNLSLNCSAFAFGLSRMAVTGYPYYQDTTREFNNNVTVDSCNWVLATPRAFGSTFYDNIFGAPTIDLPTTAIDTTENSFDLGAGHNLVDGVFIVHGGSVANHGLSITAGYFVRFIAGTNRIRFYSTYENYLSNTHVTGIKNLAPITLKLAVPLLDYDEAFTDGANFTTNFVDGVQAFPPSRINNIIFERNSPDHQIVKQTSKSISLDALVLNSTYEIGSITTTQQSGAFLATVSWGAKTAIFILTPKSNILGSLRRVSPLYSLSEGGNPELYYRTAANYLSISEVRGLKTTLLLRAREAGNYKVSVMPLGGGSNYFLRIEPSAVGYSGTPPAITDTAILNGINSSVLPSYEKYPLLVNREGDIESLISSAPKTVAGSGLQTLDLAVTNSYTVKASGATTLAISNLKSGIEYAFDIVHGSTPFAVTLPSTFKFPVGSDTTLSTTPNTKDKILCTSTNGISLDCQLIKDVARIQPADVPGLLTFIDANNEASLSLVTTTVGLTGTVTVADGSTTVVGTGTTFFTTYLVGESIVIASQERVVMAVTSETELTIDLPLSAAVTGVTAQRRLYNTQQIFDASGLTGRFNSDIQATVGARLQLLKKVRNGKNVLGFCPRGSEAHNMIFNYTGVTFPARSVLYSCLYRGLRDGKRLFTSANNDASLTFRSTNNGAVRVTSGTANGAERAGFYAAGEGTVSGFSISNQGAVKLFKNGQVIQIESIAPPTFEANFHLAATNLTGLPIYFSEIYISNTEWTDTQIFAISEMANNRNPSY